MESLKREKHRAAVSRDYLPVLGATLIATGIVYLALSLLPALVAATHDKELNPNVQGFAAFGWIVDAISLSPKGIVALGLLLQITLGWILGVLTIAAGLSTLRKERLSFVRKVTVANLFYLPIGSTVGAVALLGLKRDRVKAQFVS